jgi:hypothetical protein
VRASEAGLSPIIAAYACRDRTTQLPAVNLVVDRTFAFVETGGPRCSAWQCIAR